MSKADWKEADPATLAKAKLILKDFEASVLSLDASSRETYAAAILILASVAVCCGKVARVHPVDIVANMAEAAMRTVNDPRNGATL